AVERCGVRVWDWRTGKSVRDVVINDRAFGRAWKVALSPDGTRVAGALHDFGGERDSPFPVVRVWDVDSGKELFKGWPGGGADAVAFSAKGRRRGAGGMLRDGAEHNGTLEVGDYEDNNTLFRVRADKHGLFCLAYRPDGKVIATGGTEPEVKLWDARTGELLGKLEGHA